MPHRTLRTSVTYHDNINVYFKTYRLYEVFQFVSLVGLTMLFNNDSNNNNNKNTYDLQLTYQNNF